MQQDFPIAVISVHRAPPNTQQQANSGHKNLHSLEFQDSREMNRSSVCSCVNNKRAIKELMRTTSSSFELWVRFLMQMQLHPFILKVLLTNKLLTTTNAFDASCAMITKTIDRLKQV